MSTGNLPGDQSQRDQFINELDRNFSVIAPAGVGKTRAIVERIVKIAHRDLKASANNNDRWLPRLMVVTYTNRAAEEMQARARNHLIGENLPPEVLSWFNQAFFGTIHSLCLRILQQHGHHLGLPSRPDLVQNEDELWLEFLRQTDNPTPDVPTDLLKLLLRFIPLARLLDLGRKAPAANATVKTWPECPSCDFDPVFAALMPSHAASVKAVTKRLAELRDWIENFQQGQGNLSFPTEPGDKAAEILVAWKEAFYPIHQWLNTVSHLYGSSLARSFQEFRIRRGTLTYQDQLELAARLMRIDACRQRLVQDEPRIILDEAQDTDTAQFEVLLALATPTEKLWNPEDPAPAPGRFCMVGDPQQSIYGERADVRYYTRLHETLCRKQLATELRFQVTFRCDQAIIDRVNQLFPKVLDGEQNQVSFVPLLGRPEITPGQFVRLDLAAPSDFDPSCAVAIKTREEATQIAQWLAKTGLSKLGASSWSQVAILCPRTRLLGSLGQCFREVGLRFQLQSQRSILGDQPAFAWLTAMARVTANPGQEFEIVGVLREIFGHADEDLALYSYAQRNSDNPKPFALRNIPDSSGTIEKSLQALYEIHAISQKVPLSDTVRQILQLSAIQKRLEAIGEYPFSGELLETLLLQADLAEEEGLSLAEFATDLETHFYDREESQPLDPDAIQLISCQKSKGLEWEVVIVPYFFREISFVNDSYPRSIRLPGESPCTLSSKSSDLDGILEKHEQFRMQEFQRLLYVSLTRGKRLTVVVDDSALFAADKTEKVCFARLLEIHDEGGNRSIWKGLPSLQASPKTGKSISTTETEEQTTPEDFSSLMAKALEQAGQFSHRVLPHTLAHPKPHEDPEIRKEREPEWPQPTEENPGILYGTWWHETVEFIPWKKDPASWTESFLKRHLSCPQPERGLSEWELLLKSPIPARLHAPGTVVHSELPFLLPRSLIECLEGIIDLAAYETESQSWLVLDWKTDAISKVSDLKSHYGPQIQAYLDAIASITKLPVTGLLYSTRLGKTVEL